MMKFEGEDGDEQNNLVEYHETTTTTTTVTKKPLPHHPNHLKHHHHRRHYRSHRKGSYRPHHLVHRTFLSRPLPDSIFIRFLIIWVITILFCFGQCFKRKCQNTFGRRQRASEIVGGGHCNENQIDIEEDIELI